MNKVRPSFPFEGNAVQGKIRKTEPLPIGPFVAGQRILGFTPIYHSGAVPKTALAVFWDYTKVILKSVAIMIGFLLTP
ncbi:hypothetical protein [Pricia sp.]|uniref:hypothetical protein n=1 Tax=Pricia sp. TaxID=2268138 RepID=UPI0035942637